MSEDGEYIEDNSSEQDLVYPGQKRDRPYNTPDNDTPSSTPSLDRAPGKLIFIISPT